MISQAEIPNLFNIGQNQKIAVSSIRGELYLFLSFLYVFLIISLDKAARIA